MSAFAVTPFRRLADQVVPAARPHLAALYPAIAVPVLLANIALGLLQRRMLLDFWSETTFSFALFGLVMLTVALAAAVFLFAYGALSVAAMDAVDGREIDMRRAWLFTVRPRMLFTFALLIAATLAATVALVLPVLVVMPLLSLTLQVAVAEEKFGFAALERSASLTWWSPTGPGGGGFLLRAAALLVIGWAIQASVSTLAQGPFLALQQYLVLRDAAGGVADPAAAMGPLWLQVTSHGLGALVTTLCWFYWAFGFALLYREIRRRREAGDLRRAIAELSGREAAGLPLAQAP